MDRHLFAKKRVSLAVSVALGAVAAAPVAAQQSENANDQVMEEVVVTGIRSSLKRAMDTKRDATGVVDAITAEDIRSARQDLTGGEVCHRVFLSNIAFI